MIIFDAYKKMLIIQVIAAVTAFLGVLIDNIVVSRFLGTTCMAALGFAQPVIIVLASIGLILCVGTQGLAGKMLGNGDIEGVNVVVSIDLFLSFVFGVIIAFILFVFSREIVIFLGAKEETIDLASIYVKGFSFNACVLIAGPCLTSIMQIDNDIKRSFISVAVMTLSGAIFDLINVFVVHGGMFGMGFTTTMSGILNVIILLMHFTKKDIMLRPKLSLINLRKAIDIILMGLPAAVQQMCIVCRTVILNIIVFDIAGNVAVAAFTVQNAVMPLLMAVINGVGATTILVTGALIGIKERYSLKVLTKKIYKLAVIISLVEGAILFIFAKCIAIFFVNAEEIGQCMLVTRVLRFYALSIPLCMMVTLSINFYQSMGKLILANLSYVFEIVVFSVGISLVLSKMIGLDGVWIAFIFAEIASIIMLLLVVVYNQKRFPKRFTDILMIPDSFGVDKDHRINVTVESIEEASKISEEIMSFCEKNGIDRRRSMYSALSMEEMSTITLKNNINAEKKCKVDVFVAVEGQDLRICLRDNGKEFNPDKYRDLLNPKDSASNIAIRMFYKMVKDVQYRNLFTMNVLTFNV